MSTNSNQNTKKPILIGVVFALLLAVGASSYLTFTSSSLQVSTVETRVLENGVLAPVNPENKWHGWSTADNQVIRIEDCDEWDYYWVYQGPAVSNNAAEQTGFPGITVSTEYYVKNQHLDEDKDGVICYFENLPKPNPESASGDWLKAFDQVWSSLNGSPSDTAPMDFASSPNSVPSDAEVIRDGVEKALTAWQPFNTSGAQVYVTVVHPSDKEWFLERWETLGKGGVDEGWFDAVQEWGGGAAGPNPDGSISMYFMASENFTPPTGAFDFYFHEATHVFESQWRSEPTGPIACWTVEGPASFIGFANVDPQSKENSQNIYSAMRFDRAAVLARYFKSKSGLDEEVMKNLVLEGVNSDGNCQFEAPYFGYNLGMFITEKLLIDFGFEGFVALAQQEMQGSKDDLAVAFETSLSVSYLDWVDQKLVPYLVTEISRLTAVMD